MAVTTGWHDEVIDNPLRNMIIDAITRVQQEDPTCGKWYVDGHKFEIWVHMISLAIGVVLVTNGEVACWLHPENDVQYINIAVGVKLALQWKATRLHLFTDYAYVNGWISDVLSRNIKASLRCSFEGGSVPWKI